MIEPRPVKWGELGLITYARTYAREKKNGKKENFTETVERELKGAEKQLKVPFTEEEKEFYRNMRHDMKGSVAGRFMWQLGTKTVDKLGLPSLQNCAFTSINHPIKPFTWAMDMLMLGSGVGFSIEKKYVNTLPKLQKKKISITRRDEASADFIVPDTREGWVKLLGRVLKSYFYSGEGFTYSTQLIRAQGEPIKGFGGVASGAAVLVEGMELIGNILDARRGQQVRPIDCLDIMNIIGMIVVAGNVRRSAQIAIGDPDDVDFLKAKRWDLGNIPKWRGNSNNSVNCSDISELPQEFWDTYQLGEPYGLVNIDLSRKIGRVGETQYPDPGVKGFNPCAEQPLEDNETCALAEVFLPNCDTMQEFWEVVRVLYKVVKHSLALSCHQKETEYIVNKNMRMGIGITGVMMATEEQKSWLDPVYKTLRQYDKEYSKEHGFPESIKLTTLKPSGTLSLLPGVTPGVHTSPGGRTYIRRITIASDSPLIDVVRSHGYHLEYKKNIDKSLDYTSMIAEFPVKLKEEVPEPSDLDVLEQLDLVREMQTKWSDNAVSVTAYYSLEDIPRIQEYLKKHYKDSIKSVSFLLHTGHGFEQAPYEPISEEQYQYLAAKVKPILEIDINEDDLDDLGACGLGGCPIK
jgi:ribonucleoside-triphosphate reductase (thioredoxin)